MKDTLRFDALNFIANRGSDCVGVIDSETKLAAAVLFARLKDEGLLASTPTPDGPEYSLTDAGRAALRPQ
jgi:DNA-binding transcriptional regulator PaaX